MPVSPYEFWSFEKPNFDSQTANWDFPQLGFPTTKIFKLNFCFKAVSVSVLFLLKPPTKEIRKANFKSYSPIRAGHNILHKSSMLGIGFMYLALKGCSLFSNMTTSININCQK